MLESRSAVMRQSSIEMAEQLGIRIPTSLPNLEPLSVIKGAPQVLDRLFCLNAVAAVAYGFSHHRARAWLDREGLLQSLTKEEADFVGGAGSREPFQLVVEGAWALAWALRLVPALDPWVGADPAFVRLLPDLKADESTTRLRESAGSLRSDEELLSALDLTYCLHWAVRDAALTRSPAPGELAGYVTVERRRALEWLVSDARWDKVALDT